MGQHVVEDMDRANAGPNTVDSGVWYAVNYESEHCDRWQEEFRTGFAPPAYWEKLGFMEWRLKPRVSAADGIRAWLKGLTIAECRTTLIAIEFDTIRAGAGDDKFDAKFGSADKVTPAAQRVIISIGAESQISQFMKPTEVATSGI